MTIDLAALKDGYVQAEIEWLRSNGRTTTANLIEGMLAALEEASQTVNRAATGRKVKYRWENLKAGDSALYEKGDRPALLSSAYYWARRYYPTATFSSAKEGNGIRITRTA